MGYYSLVNFVILLLFIIQHFLDIYNCGTLVSLSSGFYHFILLISSFNHSTITII